MSAHKVFSLKGFGWVAVAGVAFLLMGGARSASGAIIYNQGVGATWNSATNWTPNTIPNAVGANATFNNAASASNAAQTANRTITMDAAQTVGSIVFNNDAANA